MAVSLKVDTQYLRNAAQEIEQNSNLYETEYKALFLDVDAMQTKWKGEDNLEFTTQIKEFETQFNKMKRLMDDYARFLRDTATAYEKTQEGIRESAKDVVKVNL